jgi:hypothetical protein
MPTPELDPKTVLANKSEYTSQQVRAAEGVHPPLPVSAYDVLWNSTAFSAEQKIVLMGVLGLEHPRTEAPV